MTNRSLKLLSKKLQLGFKDIQFVHICNVCKWTELEKLLAIEHLKRTNYHM